MRADANMCVRRFCERLGIPRSTWYYWRASHLQGREVRRWPAPVVDAIEEPAAAKAYEFSAWGHRKIWVMLRRDGYTVSQSSVKRALARRGLLMPVRYQAQRRELARARRSLFRDPPTRRNRVWQTDFSEFETTRAGTWQISGVVDYVTKVCLAAPAAGTQTAKDAIAAIHAAINEAESLLGHSLLDDCTNHHTGQITPVVIVSDNGPAYKSTAFARLIASRPELDHVRTRYRSPQTNGVVERFNETLKYDHLYRHEIPNAAELASHIDEFRRLYNYVRPHESIDDHAPMIAWRNPPGEPLPPGPSSNLFTPESVQKT